MTDAGRTAQQSEEHVPDFELRWYTTAVDLMERWLAHNIEKHLEGCDRCEKRRVELLGQPAVTGKEIFWRLEAVVSPEERLAELKKLGFDE
jgi:hypothetical protein